MRRILIESARRRGSLKRGGQAVRFSLEHDLLLQNDQSCEELIDFDEALELLAQEDPQAAELVKLRLFAGLNVARALGLQVFALQPPTTLGNLLGRGLLCG